MAKKVAQIIEEQVQFWNMRSDKGSLSGKHVKKRPIITISRSFGARGAALALELQQKLGYKVWDHDLIKAIKPGEYLHEDLFEDVDERYRDPVEDTIFGFMNHPGTNLKYMLYLSKAVRTIENLGNGIIVGRGANYLCKHPDSFHLRVVCPLKTRIENYAEREHISISKATRIVKLKDEERSTFTLRNFKKDINDPESYDLLINSGTYSMEEMTQIVMMAYEAKSVG